MPLTINLKIPLYTIDVNRIFTTDFIWIKATSFCIDSQINNDNIYVSLNN